MQVGLLAAVPLAGLLDQTPSAVFSDILLMERKRRQALYGMPPLLGTLSQPLGPASQVPPQAAPMPFLAAPSIL